MSNIKIKTQPSENHVQCSKCGGTGFYCMGVIDGRPYSLTGFKCNPCGGTGWKMKKARRQRCKRCGMLHVAGERFVFSECSGGNQRIVVCEPSNSEVT